MCASLTCCAVFFFFFFFFTEKLLMCRFPHIVSVSEIAWSENFSSPGVTSG